jgi:hypothetical protein
MSVGQTVVSSRRHSSLFKIGWKETDSPMPPS